VEYNLSISVSTDKLQNADYKLPIDSNVNQPVSFHNFAEFLEFTIHPNHVTVNKIISRLSK
jgi:hypothetical protein